MKSPELIYGFIKLSIRGEDPDAEDEQDEGEDEEEEEEDEEAEEEEDKDDNGKDDCDRYLEDEDYEKRRTKKFHNSRGHEEFYFVDRDVSSDEDQDYPDNDEDDSDSDEGWDYP